MHFLPAHPRPAAVVAMSCDDRLLGLLPSLIGHLRKKAADDAAASDAELKRKLGDADAAAASSAEPKQKRGGGADAGVRDDDAAASAAEQTNQRGGGADAGVTRDGYEGPDDLEPLDPEYEELVHALAETLDEDAVEPAKDAVEPADGAVDYPWRFAMS